MNHLPFLTTYHSHRPHRCQSVFESQSTIFQSASLQKESDSANNGCGGLLSFEERGNLLVNSDADRLVAQPIRTLSHLCRSQFGRRRTCDAANSLMKHQVYGFTSASASELDAFKNLFAAAEFPASAASTRGVKVRPVSWFPLARHGESGATYSVWSH